MVSNVYVEQFASTPQGFVCNADHAQDAIELADSFNPTRVRL